MEKKGIDFASIPQTALKVLTSPATFFREMAKTGGFVEPLVFMVILGAVTGVVDAVLGILGLLPGVNFKMAVSSIIIMPIGYAIFGFVGAAVNFVIWKLMDSQESYETAYRCTAYLITLMPIVAVLNVIPYIGKLLGIALLVYFSVTASIETHKIPSQKSWLVFGIIGAVLFIISIL